MMRVKASNPGGRNRIMVGGRVSIFMMAVSVAMVAATAAAQSAAPKAAAAHPPAVRAVVHPPEAGQQIFPSAAEASRALVAALREDDRAALLKVLGAGAGEILSSGDEVEDKDDRAQFVEKYKQMHRLLTEPNGFTTLFIGPENWPAPIPLVHGGKGWYFDTAAGKQEILYRRVGENELTVIHVCGEMVDAEKEYYAKPQDGNTVQEYAQKILSDSGKHNGLYWEAGTGETESPLGPFIAQAESEGYAENANQKREPFHGYYFRVLKGQGASAHGGARSYIAVGKMTGGFAFLAFPAEYRSSGVMTFQVGQDGVVYQKDLGSRTAEIVKSLTRYNPDATWKKAE
jgi:hypothetical protein